VEDVQRAEDPELQHRHLTATLPARLPTYNRLVPPRNRPVGALPAFGRTVPVKVVRVQADEGMDWGDAGIGAAGMLAAVLLCYGGAQALTSVSRRKRSPAHS